MTQGSVSLEQLKHLSEKARIVFILSCCQRILAEVMRPGVRFGVDPGLFERALEAGWRLVGGEVVSYEREILPLHKALEPLLTSSERSADGPPIDPLVDTVASAFSLLLFVLRDSSKATQYGVSVSWHGIHLMYFLYGGGETNEKELQWQIALVDRLSKTSDSDLTIGIAQSTRDYARGPLSTDFLQEYLEG
jgi:hypothetical protein